jgi:hypothetical protein
LGGKEPEAREDVFNQLHVGDEAGLNILPGSKTVLHFWFLKLRTQDGKRYIVSSFHVEHS